MSARLERPAGHPHVAVVTIDRPAQANALDPPTLRDLATAWREIASDPDVRCALLTGAGDRVFCAGMDMKTTIPLAQRFARGERIADDEFAALRDVPVATLASFSLGKPLVCAVNGHARAGGFDLMLASDLRFCVPGGEPMAVAGEVIWVNPLRPDDAEGRNPGMGVRFTELSAAQREEMLRLVRTFAYLNDDRDDDEPQPS